MSGPDRGLDGLPAVIVGGGGAAAARGRLFALKRCGPAAVRWPLAVGTLLPVGAPVYVVRLAWLAWLGRLVGFGWLA